MEETSKSAQKFNEYYKFYCCICMESKPVSEKLELQPCLHCFCKHCMSNYISTKVLDYSATSIKCPCLKCTTHLQNPDPYRSIVPAKVIDRWGLNLCEAALGPQKVYCPNTRCSIMFLVDDEVCRRREEKKRRNEGMFTKMKRFMYKVIEFLKIRRRKKVASYCVECPYCHELMCHKCRSAWHDGISCEMHRKLSKNDLKGKAYLDGLVMKLVKKKGWRRCPKCRFFVERVEGCNYMFCRCYNTFCYKCAGPVNSESHSCRNCGTWG